MIRVERIIDALPGGLDALRAEARREGHRMLDTLAREWAAGTRRFDKPGEALFVAYSADVLPGIGGMTVEPTICRALRMRRFYVGRSSRRLGIARMIAVALLNRPAIAARPVTVNAAPGSEPFWEAIGFAPDRRDGHTHMRWPR